jgi:ABC-type proline/glycine betaine transport system permease subunit
MVGIPSLRLSGLYLAIATMGLAFIIEGAVPAAILAVLADQLLANIEAGFAYPIGLKLQ